MIDSEVASAASPVHIGDLSSIATPGNRFGGANESSFIEPGPYYYSPRLTLTNEDLKMSL